VLKLAELAQSGALGNIASVCTYRLGWAHTPSDVDVAWHLAPHDLSIALEILGYLPPVKSAVGLNVSPTLQSLQAVLQDPSGGPQVQLDVSSAHPVNRRSVTIIGSTGLAALGGSYDKHIVLMPKAGEPEHISIEQKMPLLAELDTFLKHLAGGPPPKSTAREAAIIISRLSEIRCLAGFE
jgi:predicted dehydrogenase